MREVTKLKSGRILTLLIADFDVASELQEVFVNELKTVQIDLGNLVDYMNADGDVALLLGDARIVNTFKNALCQLLGSKKFKLALFDCMKFCTLTDQAGQVPEKITKQTFEQAREDFIPVCWEVARFTLGPFVAGLDLKSLTKPSAPNDSQR